ncbi:hypothetical protein ACH4LH_31135 [Streptomyces anulatus]
MRIGGRGTSNVLVVQNERDPGRAQAGARAPRRAVGRSVGSAGHARDSRPRRTQCLPFGGNTYAEGVVTAFLPTGQQSARDPDRPEGPGGR